MHATWDTVLKVSRDVVSGLKPSSVIRYQGMTETTLDLIRKRTTLQTSMRKPRINERRLETLQQQATTLGRKIQVSVRKDKTAHLELMASKVQKNVCDGNMRDAFKAIKEVTGKSQGGAAGYGYGPLRLAQLLIDITVDLVVGQIVVDISWKVK
uniref:Uncharacterized protein n=1 Tax=Mantoniella antarctica TaxID=81844 RepID=A0A7S0STV5_9CHLO|mmetsp:Transcript_36182/g.90336  ORF Transcript_36182/g.90336 Transcript_36182/m.90336 type:complete len:154 (+) Transcript_36182:263-724(+)|eukprot:CAMPEP_0181363712 /NCGR_PEP_ID=MMETSP1106-20121128/8914_1 /TAXON_ID=81844 /ORGANISM="Mantoniella antarctica, Strain SL-175" /LENGTH=153 /DNA_ID=CAMNT_0023478207 /DNA_START=248 /DNA_END=709 /DNA_ORIENTATION=-